MSLFRLLGIMFIIFLIGQIFNYADGAEINSKIMGAIAKVESNCNPGALGDDNRSLGLFQVQMGTARLLGFKGTRKELLNPKINYAYARIYMEHLKKKYKGNLCRVLYVYNSGDYAALKYKTFCDKIYPRKIFKAIKDGDICEIKKITGREI